ncbi:beta-1,4-galactosyltransferase 4-like [Tubulanus polymorphus]|uniref:beta-1,4-galactosyltransferase 4-like n=1 Tax=Tubulanus polymorphus TaxID=672921 RepID=UPI003DA2327E
MYGGRRWVVIRPVSGTMFKKRDIPPVLMLLMLIILVMLTLSQILVVHNGRYGRNFHHIRKIQMELREIDVGIRKLLSQNVPSIDLNAKLFRNKLNEGKFRNILNHAQDIWKVEQMSSRGRGTRTGSFRASKNSKYGRMIYKKRSFSRRGKSKLEFSDHNQFRTMDVNPVRSHGVRETKAFIETADKGAYYDKEWDDSKIAAKHSTRVIKYCAAIPQKLEGRVFLSLSHPHNFTMQQVLLANREVRLGGWHRPDECVSRHKLAVIIPYRDRNQHLVLLLAHLHPILQRQQLDYRVFVVEQTGRDTFNKARIMNAGFIEALKMYNFQCFAFHDVDLVPEDDRNMYSCPSQPRHMSVAIDEMGYKLAYPELVGGVLVMRSEHFQRVNGYSNMYWGWGAEDDDMAYRIMHVGLKITRPANYVARYKMIRHTKRKPSDWRKRTKLLYTATRRRPVDGLNSLRYKLLFVKEEPLYTHIMLDIGKPPRGA